MVAYLLVQGLDRDQLDKSKKDPFLYAILSDDPPTVAAFVERYSTTPLDAWDPMPRLQAPVCVEGGLLYNRLIAAAERGNPVILRELARIADYKYV